MPQIYRGAFVNFSTSFEAWQNEKTNNLSISFQLKWISMNLFRWSTKCTWIIKQKWSSRKRHDYIYERLLMALHEKMMNFKMLMVIKIDVFAVTTKQKKMIQVTRTATWIIHFWWIFVSTKTAITPNNVSSFFFSLLSVSFFSFEIVHLGLPCSHVVVYWTISLFYFKWMQLRSASTTCKWNIVSQKLVNIFSFSAVVVVRLQLLFVVRAFVHGNVS